LPAVKTNNSHLRPKVDLRVGAVKAIDKPRVKVLDAFAGEGVVWRAVERALPDVTFDYLRIDKRKYDGPDTVYGDNLKILPALDLAEFDFIDLDAYGVPHKQLRVCAEKAPQVPVGVTCIMHPMGSLPREVLVECGVPEEWTYKDRCSPLVFGRDRVRWWDDYCSRLGYGFTRREVYTGGMVKMYQVLWLSNPG
jgi:hypothetical protein